MTSLSPFAVFAADLVDPGRTVPDEQLGLVMHTATVQTPAGAVPHPAPAAPRDRIAGSALCPRCRWIGGDHEPGCDGGRFDFRTLADRARGMWADHFASCPQCKAGAR